MKIRKQNAFLHSSIALFICPRNSRLFVFPLFSFFHIFFYHRKRRRSYIQHTFVKTFLGKRLRIFCNFLSLQGKTVDPAGITMTFTRALPKNLLEISQIVANLWGKVSRKTLLSQIPFVDNVDDELEALDQETEENMKRQQEVFGLQSTPPDSEDPDKAEKKDDSKKGQCR